MEQEMIDAFNYKILEPIYNYKHIISNQNTVYLINNKYVIKGYDNTMEINVRKEQLRISREWIKKGIPCIEPLTDIYSYNNKYYVIYPYIVGKSYEDGELNLGQIKKLARIQAKMHKMNIKSDLESHLRPIDLKDKVLNKFISKSNKAIKNNHLHVCDNDYKALNVIWKDNEPYILDYDAVFKNNPTISLLECAYNFSHKGNRINLDYYKAYISEYMKEYRKPLENVEDAIYSCWSGKLQWLSYLKNNRPGDPDIKKLTYQMTNYEKYIKDIKRILKEVG